MKTAQFGLILLGIGGAIGAFGSPVKPVGEWVGHYHMVIPQDVPANVRKDIERRSAGAMKSVMRLNLSGDKSFSMTLKKGDGSTTKPKAFAGTWISSKTEIVLQIGKNPWHLIWLPGGKSFRESSTKGGTTVYCDFSRV